MTLTDRRLNTERNLRWLRSKQTHRLTSQLFRTTPETQAIDPGLLQAQVATPHGRTLHTVDMRNLDPYPDFTLEFNPLNLTEIFLSHPFGAMFLCGLSATCLRLLYLALAFTWEWLQQPIAPPEFGIIGIGTMIALLLSPLLLLLRTMFLKLKKSRQESLFPQKNL